MILSISNNNYILKVGDLIKFIKETKYVNSIRIKIMEKAVEKVKNK